MRASSRYHRKSSDEAKNRLVTYFRKWRTARCDSQQQKRLKVSYIRYPSGPCHFLLFCIMCVDPPGVFALPEVDTHLVKVHSYHSREQSGVTSLLTFYVFMTNAMLFASWSGPYEQRGFRWRCRVLFFFKRWQSQWVEPPNILLLHKKWACLLRLSQNLFPQSFFASFFYVYSVFSILFLRILCFLVVGKIGNGLLPNPSSHRYWNGIPNLFIYVFFNPIKVSYIPVPSLLYPMVTGVTLHSLMLYGVCRPRVA